MIGSSPMPAQSNLVIQIVGLGLLVMFGMFLITTGIPMLLRLETGGTELCYPNCYGIKEINVRDNQTVQCLITEMGVDCDWEHPARRD